MIEPRWIDHDTLEVPMPSYDEATGLFGDGIAQIGPEHKNFEQWERYITEQLGVVRPAAS